MIMTTPILRAMSQVRIGSESSLNASMKGQDKKKNSKSDISGGKNESVVGCMECSQPIPEEQLLVDWNINSHNNINGNGIPDQSLNCTSLNNSNVPLDRVATDEYNLPLINTSQDFFWYGQ